MPTNRPTSLRETTAATHDRDDIADRADASDADLLRAASRAISRPRTAPADSFVLHAPLELLARAGLLPHVRPGARDLARRRIATLAAAYENAAPPIADPHPHPRFDSVGAAGAALEAALRAGDLDAVDAAATHLGAHAGPAELRSLLADAVLPSLAAAAHAPIFLAHLPAVAPHGDWGTSLLRPLAREVARAPQWRLHAIERPRAGRAHPSAPEPAERVLARVPTLGVPGSTFIYPLMAQVDGPLLADVVARAGVFAMGTGDLAGLGHEIRQVAARSMLLESTEHAPYGWTHALTMPDAALRIAGATADPARAAAVALAYVVGFRAALAARPVTDEYAPAAPDRPLAAALDSDPDVAEAGVWRADRSSLPAIVTELATRAATAHDAHRVKYTFTCIAAAGAHPQDAPLFLAAAAKLGAWWDVNGDPDDRLVA